MSFASWETVLLAVLVLASTAVFAREVQKRLRLILAGPSDRPRLDHVGRRLWVTFKEVVFQTRVMGGRPVAGALHAMVFFGFVAFGLETIDHFSEGFGLPFLSALIGSHRQSFELFIAVMAWLVLIGIVGLSFRRFVLVRFSPDPTSIESGLVALLIVTLMVTYLNGIAAEPVVARANWWAHSLVILVFPHLIVRSKHLHLIIAPINIFLRTPRLGDLLPLELDAEVLAELAEEEFDLGLETLKDVPRKLRADFLSCVECNRCTENCPANLAGQTLDPRGFILAGQRALLAGDETAPVVGSIITEEALGQCTSCGACEAACPMGIEHMQLLTGAKRSQALASGLGMVASDFLQTVERSGNAFGEGPAARAQLIQSLEIPVYEAGKTEWLLWMGCVWSYNRDTRDSLAAMVRILKNAGVSFGVLAEEQCTGHHSRRQGEEMQFQTLAQGNIGRLKEMGVKKLLSPCPHCLHTFRREYPTLDGDFSVAAVHHSELLFELLSQGAIKLRQLSDTDQPLTTYHDPCYLGRYEGVFDAPREIIQSVGLPLVELPRNRERSYCCGGGNAGFRREQEVPERVDQVRKDEIQASGAKLLVTGCPECKMMLNDTTDETRDLAEIVADRMA